MKKLLVIVVLFCGMVLFGYESNAMQWDLSSGLGVSHRYHENKAKVAFNVNLQTKVDHNLWAGPFLFMNNKNYLGYGVMISFDFPTIRRNVVTWEFGIGCIQKKMAIFSGFEF